MWYEILVRGRKVADVYSEEDIISTSCDLVHGCGVDPDDIEVITHERR